ncbi:drug/metabolite transporter (DMT)-like permease [Microvirga flocculans]|uniref:Drug/metabolite transporter (DMT)-like permease n=1 Tax=Microvirga flocculans TaxID=217168 RepID=A0A7W6IFL1_9HYPH|nr:DMT family transporter [Microvirga flocculans]MBB4040557.1 drug/metabolite transporter (DMT)-like permease [Microvirga flocculans]
MTASLLWIPVTLAAAAAQTGRNATQRRLTETIGTVGATQVRFLYGFPFALLALAAVSLVTGETMPHPNAAFLAYVLSGALTQILATALMLSAMRERAFSVVTAYTKTEPVQVALFGLVLLGDTLTPAASLAIAVATAGVVLMSVKPGAGLTSSGLKPVVFGLASGAFFALAAIGFRGAILSLEAGSPLIRASTTLAWGLGLQTAILIAWLGLFDRKALVGSFAAWCPSLGAGFLGALASQFWFIGFALTTAANVRTLALVEVLMAQAVSHRFLAQATTKREVAGMLLILGGVALLLLSHR